MQKQAKIAVEHGASLDELDQSIEIVIGKAKTGVRTEAQFNTVDRIAKKMQSSWIGKYVNETTIASGVAIAYATAIGLSQRLASSKAFAWGTFGASALVGGAVAGMRESVRIEEERQQHARERAKGKEIVPDSARRNEMEGVIHGTVPAGELTHRLKNIPEVFESEEEYFAALNVLAQTESRIRLSDTEKIDLLSYTDFGSIEQERLTLDIARATAKVRLRNAVQDGAVATPDGATFDDLYQAALTAHTTEIRTGEGGIEAMDRCFSKMKRRKVAGAVGKAVLTGLAVGGVVQEAAAFAHESREGVVEHMFHAQGAKAPDAVTALEGLRRWVTSEVPLGRIVSNTILPDGSHVALPDGVELIHNPLNVAEYTLIKDGEVIPGKLEFQQGVLTKASEDILAQHGVSLEKHINHFQSQQDTQLPARTFVEQNTDLFHKISRKFWYDNDTSPFDKNELRLRWGGQNGMGIDSSGKYVFNIGSMTQDGSQSNQMSVDAQDAVKNGKLKLLLSLSKDSQSSVVEVPIDAEGNAVIDPQSKIGKLFFKQEGGKLSFVGKFAEIAHEVGTTKTGVPQFGILATHIGEGVSHVMDQVFTHAEIPVSRFGVNDTEPFIEPPIVVPLFGRRPLERLNTMREPSVGAFDDFENDESGNASRPSGGTSQSHGGDSTDVHEPQPPTMSAPYGFRETNVFEYGYNGLSYITRKEYEHRMSDTLRSDPDAKLDEQTEINGYFSRLEKEYMSMVDVLSRQAGPMNPECMLTVCIPVAGHQEGKNIYKTLENYLNQTADKAVFEIVLFVNQPDVDTEGSPIVADETFAEIERFMKDNPGIHIAVMQSVIPREKVQIGYIRKLLNDAVLKRNIGRTKKENSDHIMVSNDADNKGMSYEYIQNFINKFKSAPSTDAFMGQLDWDPVSYVRNPLVHIGTRLFQYVDTEEGYS